MTNGSCHSTCESNVHTWLKPAASAFLARSTTASAGGSFCSTTPMSTALPSEQVVREAARDVLAAPGPPGVLAAAGDHLAAGQHGVDLAVDLPALPGGVVHVHVVRLDADPGAAVRVVQHDVGVRAGRDDALLGIHAEHP